MGNRWTPAAARWGELSAGMRGFADRFGILLVAVLMAVGLTVLQPQYFPTAGNLTNIARQISVNALLALGQFMVILTAGIDLSVGSVMALSMVTMALLAHAGAPACAALIVSVAVGGLCGLLNAWGLTVLRLPHPFIVTLAMLNIARGATMLISDGVPISGLPPALRFLGSADLPLYETVDQRVGLPISLFVVLALYGLAWLFLVRTRTGRHIYAVGGSSQAAAYAGIKVNRVLLTVYVLCGLLAAVAGVLLAGRTNSGYPNAGQGAELDAIAAVIIGGASFFGGRGTVAGTLVGVLIMGLLRNGLNLMDVSSFWQMVVIGVVIVLAVYVDVLRQRAPRKI